jgi:hypothetical protein
VSAREWQSRVHARLAALGILNLVSLPGETPRQQAARIGMTLPMLYRVTRYYRRRVRRDPELRELFFAWSGRVPSKTESRGHYAL